MNLSSSVPCGGGSVGRGLGRPRGPCLVLRCAGAPEQQPSVGPWVPRNLWAGAGDLQRATATEL